MDNPAKRKIISRDSYQAQYHHNNQKLLIDNATNTECQKPMMLNAWTQTETDEFKLKPEKTLIDDLQERIRKLEEMFRVQSIALNECQTTQFTNQNTPTNCINGKTIQNQLIRKSPSKLNTSEKATYKIVAGPAGMEIIEPIEVEYAEEDGTYLDNDLNTSSDSNRLEICIPKDEYSTNNEQQQQHQHSIEQIPQHQQNVQTYSIQEYSHQQSIQQQQQTIQLQTSSSQHNSNSCQSIHNSQAQLQPPQIYQTQINGTYHTLSNSQQHHHHQQQDATQPQQQSNNRNLQYISVVHSSNILNGNSIQQPQNVIITTQHTQQQQQQNQQRKTVASSISPISTDSIKLIQRHKQKCDIRHYVSEENLLNSSTPEANNEVTVSAISSSSYREIKKEISDHHDNVSSQHREEGRQSSLSSNLITHQELNDIEVSLGPNNTRIPAAIYEAIDWNSVTIATRKLLITIFDRETLATHTMTGKPSPAFKGRDLPSKHQLNPSAVQDIIFAVSRKCNVPEKEVRTAITTKCADENKMLKQREKKRRSLQESNKENLIKNGVGDSIVTQ